MDSSSKPEFNQGVPWYRNHDYYVSRAAEYLAKFSKFKRDSEHRREIEASFEFNVARLIFESNLIEGAGFPSEGETRKIIADHLPALPANFSAYVPFYEEGGGIKSLFSKPRIQDIDSAIKKAALAHREIIPSISFAGKPRAYREVGQHLVAAMEARFLALQWITDFSMELAWKSVRSINVAQEERKKFLRAILEARGKKRIQPRKLFTHASIRKLHSVMASSLLPADSHVRAGQYRIDNRSVGWEIQFPGPDLVRDCMDEFIAQSDRVMRGTYSGASQAAVFGAAAEISYHFVRIHPFPDFNGRLSRIIMNMVLMPGKSPVPIALRGNKKGKNRYFTALRHANRGNLRSLTTLIAMRFVETLEEIDKNLSLAGKPTIWDTQTDD